TGHHIRVVGQLLEQDLDRHGLAGVPHAAAPHRAEGASAQLGLQLVAAADRLTHVKPFPPRTRYVGGADEAVLRWCAARLVRGGDPPASGMGVCTLIATSNR